MIATLAKMLRQEKKVDVEHTPGFGTFAERLSGPFARLPVLSVALYGWNLASRAYADDNRGHRVKQRWKSFLSALLYPRFAERWFQMLRSPELLFVAKHRQCLYLKPFRVYMSTRWKRKQRLKVILDTYRLIDGKGDLFKRALTQKCGISLAHVQLNSELSAALTLGYDERYRKEGELVLSFTCPGLAGMLAAAAFSFEETEPGRWACRIGCLQGHERMEANPSKVAQKLMYGLRPKSLVVFALQELSRALGCVAIYAAGDSIQAYRRKHAVHLPWRHGIHFDYDATWSESAGWPDREGWYELPINPVRKQLHEIKPNKRSGYRKRYGLQECLSNQIATAVKGFD